MSKVKVIFPKIIHNQEEDHRIVWVDPDTVVVETVSGRSSLGEIQWKKCNQPTSAVYLARYLAKRLRDKFSIESKAAIEQPVA